MSDSKYTLKGLLMRVGGFVLWLGLLVFLVDGLGYFPVLEEKLGYVVTETMLWVLVLIPAAVAFRYWRKYRKLKH